MRHISSSSILFLVVLGLIGCQQPVPVDSNEDNPYLTDIQRENIQYKESQSSFKEQINALYIAPQKTKLLNREEDKETKNDVASLDDAANKKDHTNYEQAKKSPEYREMLARREPRLGSFKLDVKPEQITGPSKSMTVELLLTNVTAEAAEFPFADKAETLDGAAELNAKRVPITEVILNKQSVSTTNLMIAPGETVSVINHIRVRAAPEPALWYLSLKHDSEEGYSGVVFSTHPSDHNFAIEYKRSP